MNEWIKEMWYTSPLTQWNIIQSLKRKSCHSLLYSKRNNQQNKRDSMKGRKYLQHGWNLGHYDKWNKSDKDKYCLISQYMWNLKKLNSYSRLVIVRGLGSGRNGKMLFKVYKLPVMRWISSGGSQESMADYS